MGFEDAGREGDRIEDDVAQSSTTMNAPSGLGLMALRDLIADLLAHRKTILTSVGVTFAIGVFFLATAPIKYTAYVVLAPLEERSNLSASSEGILSTIGLNVGSQKFSPFDHFIETLTSAKLAEKLNRDMQFSQRIFSYDKEDKEFVRSKSPVALVRYLVNWLFGQPGWQPPKNYDLARYLKSQIGFETERKAASVTITYEHRSPEFAREFLSLVTTKADEILRSEEKAMNTARHGYLEQKLQTEPRQINRSMVAQLLLDAEQRLMLANVDPMFGARIIDGPISSSKPSSPNILRGLIISLVLGFMVGIALVVIRILVKGDER